MELSLPEFIVYNLCTFVYFLYPPTILLTYLCPSFSPPTPSPCSFSSQFSSVSLLSSSFSCYLCPISCYYWSYYVLLWDIQLLCSIFQIIIALSWSSYLHFGSHGRLSSKNAINLCILWLLFHVLTPISFGKHIPCLPKQSVNITVFSFTPLYLFIPLSPWYGNFR